MRASRVVLAVLAVVFAVGMLSCDNPTAVQRQLSFAWLAPPPDALREGDSATVTVELRDASGQPTDDFDGATVELRFVFQSGDSLPGTACGAACTTTVSQGRAGLTVAWMSAGRWAVSACVRPPAGGDELCAQHAVEVLAVHAALVTYPADSIGRRVRFPVEARLRLPDGTAVTDQARNVRLRFTSAAPAAGHVRCPEAGPVCERTPVAGVVHLDSVVVLDTAVTTLDACAVAPNGRERCDPAGPRAFRVVVPRVSLHFVTEPSGGAAGVPFATQPVVEALEPDSSRRADFTDLVHVALGAGAQLGPVLAGTGADGAVTRGTVTVQALAGVATFTDLRVTRADGAYTLVASAAGAVPDTSALFSGSLGPSQLALAKFAGDSQYGWAGTVLPVAPAVLVSGPLGDPIDGIVVEFAIGTGGWWRPGSLAGGMLRASDTTDVTGVASAGPWTLGPDVLDTVVSPFAPNELAASVRDVSAVLFYAEGIVPRALSFVTPPSDIVAGDTIRPAVVVEIQDYKGRGVLAFTDSVFVRTFRAPRFLTIDDPPPDIRDDLLGTHARAAAGGRATFDDLSLARADSFRLMAALQNTLWAATQPDPRDRPILTSARVKAYPRVATARLVRVGGDGRSALVGTAIDSVPTARVEDSYGNGIAGRTVTFAVTAGGGSVTDSVQVTDADGLARPGSWTLGSAPGPNTLTATAGGIDSSVMFTATATAEAVPFERLVFATSPSDLVAGDTMRPAVIVELQDALGRRAFGATDSVYVSARLDGGGFLLGTTVRAAVDGRATFDDLWLTRAGTFDFHAQDAIVASPGGREASATFVVSPRAAPAWIVAVTGLNQSATAGSTVDTVPVVRVEDIYANPIPGRTVTFAATIGGGSVTGPVQVTDGNGLARPGTWTLGSSPGLNALTAYAAGMDSVAFIAYGIAPTFDAGSVSAGYDFTCATARDSNLPYCWGENGYGQLGDGTQTARNRPTLVAGGLLALTQVSAGLRFACGLAVSGAASCWGDNTNGQLGRGNTDSSWTPVAVAGGHTFRQIAAGASHVCALDTGGIAWCWGTDGWGQLGNGTAPSSDQPQPVQVSTALRFTQIVAGAFHTCGISEAGQAWCWGYNLYGAAGDGTTTSYLYSPAPVAGTRTFTHLSAGSSHTCGVSSGSVYCWGRNNEGQLGTGATSTTPSREPVPALGALGTTMRVAAGGTHSCAVNSGGETYCWGMNDRGQLGDASTTPRTSGSLVSGGNAFVAITAGQSHTCGQRQNGATFCWGWSYLGRLGIGMFGGLSVSTPVAVMVP